MALTPNYDVYFKLGMLWGVTPLLDKIYYDTDELLKSAKERAVQARCVESGDIVVQTAGIMTCVSGSPKSMSVNISIILSTERIPLK